MKLSTKGRYALRFMIDLAEHADEESVSLKSIAERQDISKKYLERITPSLNRAGLLKVSRGYNGGYRLAKSPSEITVGEVVRASEGDMLVAPCCDCAVQTCSRVNVCAAYNVWKGLQESIESYLDGLTLQDVVDKYSPSPEYVI